MLTSVLPVVGIAVMSVLGAYYYHFTRSSSHASPHSRLLLFDGICVVCSMFVNFVIDHDTTHTFYFLPLQSAVGQQLLHKYNLPADLDSMVLIDHADDVVRHIQQAGGTQTVTAAGGPATGRAGEVGVSASLLSSATSSASSSSSSTATVTPVGFPLPPFPAASPSVAYIRSTAMFVTLGSLPFPLSLACMFLLLPVAIRDSGYKAFAAVRYRVFGTTEECRVPTKESRRRFLDGTGGSSNTRKDK